MINIQRLQDTLSNFKSTKINIPPFNKLSQKTAYQIKIDDLSSLQYNDNNDLNYYINKSNKSNKSNTSFNKPLNIKENNNVYTEEGVNTIQDSVQNVLGNNNDKYYLFSINSENSFFLSIIFLTQNNFIIKNVKEKHSTMILFKRELNLQIDNLYKSNQYKDLKINKKELTINIQNNKTVIDYSICILCSDYFNKNVCIINLDKNTYQYIKSYNNQNKEFFLIIKENDLYCPILNIENNNVLNESVFDNIKKNFVKEIIEEKYLERNENRIKLKAITNYKLSDLQEICNQKNITITKIVNDKEKNKTKLELYNELLL